MSDIISTISKSMDFGLAHQLIHHYTDDEQLNGRLVHINGKPHINFGSCSYLGLEQHPKLIENIVHNVRKYGSQFSSSRSYLSLGVYRELEEQFEALYGQPALISSSTTLGHLGTLFTIIEPEDAIVLDLQVHESIQVAIKTQQVPLHVIRHNAMDQLEHKVKQLRNKHQRIWYMADGIYSMYGDPLPIHELIELMEKYKQLHLYIDDAHGMSWAGKNGVGYVRSQIDHHPRMVMATSLNKSFAASGGLLVFPNREMAETVRKSGRPLSFSGPIQPPMLGAIAASLQLHTSGEIHTHQQQLNELIKYTNEGLKLRGIPQYEDMHSPLFFIPIGLLKNMVLVCQRVMKDGLFINASGFPAVPMKRSGLRFALNNHITKSDIDQLLDSIQHHYLEVIEEQGTSFAEIAKSFRMPIFEIVDARKTAKKEKATQSSSNLTIEVYTSINSIPVELWNEYFNGKGNLTHANLQLVESIFTTEDAPENKWNFHYVIIRDQHQQIVLMTYYTDALVKDDMLSTSKVSQKVEEERLLNPYYLTSRCVLLGSLITKGEHLHLDWQHQEWQQALKLLLSTMQKTAEETQSTRLLLREFSANDEIKLTDYFYDQGLVKVDMPELLLVENLTWHNLDEYQKQMGQRYRYSLRKEILPYEHHFEVDYHAPESDQELNVLYDLYLNVFDRSYEINVFTLPFSFFQKAAQHPEYEWIRLYLKNEDGSRSAQPVAFLLSFVSGDYCFAMIAGLDYDYVLDYNSYKQLLYKAVMRTKELGCTTLDFGFTAALEKKKVGATAHHVYAYAQAMEHYSLAVLDSIEQSS